MIREMIVQALDGVGGVDYLQEVARSHPTAFLGLVGKVIPVQVDAAVQLDADVEHTHKVDLDFDAIRAKLS